MFLQTARSIVVRSSSVAFFLRRVDRLSIIFIHWCPLDLFQVIVPVVTRCSHVFFRMIYVL